MEIYQYWTIIGLFFLVFEFFTFKTVYLALAGSMLLTAAIAIKFPDLYIVQIIAFLLFLPLFYFASKPYIKRENK